ncbi:MAG: 1-(5-phosphoribosyl)-5-[(5-phosphoribosylamino)methylideneamino]imidazole-4-carboxamide isomerase [Bacteroidetes bacterium]|nr:1-(5-phosphoribosyl)-5-[(5-phosphoribosylamino)methylideneamino]imidazole-4-carboxamide isomerase [Bacteroidota bacterium]
MKIIPAIDIIDGKCVRLTKGNYNEKIIYNEDPLEVAREFEDSGITHLHLVDLDGARSYRIINYKTLFKIVTKTKLKVDFGGGIKSWNDLEIAFDSGAAQITIGSLAVKQPELCKEWITHYGNEKIILGADCSNRKIAHGGWIEISDYDVIDFIDDYASSGIKYVICTDISKDGMMKGPSINLYKDILKETNIDLIASGGVSEIKDIYDLKEIGCMSAIIGKAIYEGKITLKQIQEYNAKEKDNTLS